jgi:transcriptional regulator with XRE-family HTH domain
MKEEETRVIMVPTEQTYAQVVGGVLATLRFANDYTQVRVSEETGIKQTTLSRIESGDADARLSDLRPLAKLYGMTTHEILDYADKKWASGVVKDDDQEPEVTKDNKKGKAKNTKEDEDEIDLGDD